MKLRGKHRSSEESGGRGSGACTAGGGDFKDGEIHLLEDGYEQVKQQYVGKEQVDAE